MVTYTSTQCLILKIYPILEVVFSLKYDEHISFIFKPPNHGNSNYPVAYQGNESGVSGRIQGIFLPAPLADLDLTFLVRSSTRLTPYQFNINRFYGG